MVLIYSDVMRSESIQDHSQRQVEDFKSKERHEVCVPCVEASAWEA